VFYSPFVKHISVVFHHHISEYDTVEKIESLVSGDDVGERDEATGIYDSSVGLFGVSWEEEVTATMEHVRQATQD
jgi:hypothetical protein